MPTTGYNAGIETNDVEISYGKEAVWGTKPAVAFQAIRFMSESFSGSKTRNRPSEVRTDLQAAYAITTQEQASAGVNFGLSYGTYDDLLAGLFNNDWSTALTVTGTDIAATGTGLSSATASKFSSIAVGQWIRTVGFANPLNNTYRRVTAVTGTTVTLAGGLTVEAAGASVTVRGSRLTNGTVFQSFHVQKKFATAVYLLYPGTYWTGGTLSASTGQFMSGSLTGVAQIEAKQTTNQSTGAVLAAPVGRVNDNVAGFQGIELNGTAIAAVVDAVSVQITKEGAAAQYGLGDSSADGVLRGVVTVSGSIRIFFKDFTIYDLFKSEAESIISFRTVDSAGSGYQLTLPAATVMNPQVVAGGPGQAVMAEFALEGNPHGTLGYTIQLDRFL
jgi:hypothetical protein